MRYAIAVAVVALAGGSTALAGSLAHRAGAGNCAEADVVSTGWEAVFGHFKKKHDAEQLEKRAVKAGFKVIMIERDGCDDYELAVPGGTDITTQKQRRSFVAEARSAHFGVTWEAPCCATGSDSGSEWEAVFGHEPTLERATALQLRMMGRGFVSVEVEQDAAGDSEVEVPGGTGLQTRAQRKGFAVEAKSARFRVSFERS